MRRTGLAILVVVVALFLLWFAAWFLIRFELLTLLISEEEACASRFGLEGEGYQPHLEALSDFPIGEGQHPLGWTVGYVSGTDTTYLKRGYLHLAVRTLDGPRELVVKGYRGGYLDFILSGVEEWRLWEISREASFFKMGIPVVVFPDNVEGDYFPDDVIVLGYFRCEIDFDGQGNPISTGVEYITLP